MGYFAVIGLLCPDLATKITTNLDLWLLCDSRAFLLLLILSILQDDLRAKAKGSKGNMHRSVFKIFIFHYFQLSQCAAFMVIAAQREDAVSWPHSHFRSTQSPSWWWGESFPFSSCIVRTVFLWLSFSSPLSLSLRLCPNVTVWSIGMVSACNEGLRPH